MSLPVDPTSVISGIKYLHDLTIFLIRLARQDTLEMREWVEAIAALSFQLPRAKDTLALVQDWVVFMNGDGVASRALRQKADEVRLDERMKKLRDHIASLEDLFKQAQLDSDNTTRRDLIILRINIFAKERKVEPLVDGRRKLVHLVKDLDQGIMFIRDSYNRLPASVDHSPPPFDERLRSARTELRRAFKDSPFCLQFHPTGHLAEELLGLMSPQCALPELEEIFTTCGQKWVESELLADATTVDRLERVEKCHRNLVSRLHQVLEEWQTSFPDLTGPVEALAQAAKEKLVEWFVVSCRRYLALTLAIGGRISEGKSSLLNAILGKKILPTDRVVETAVPCCIRHAPGQSIPALELPYMKPYTHALEQFRKLQPEDEHWSQEQQKQLNDLKCKPVVSKLFDASYTIPNGVKGEESIRELLAILNVVTRFSIITGNEIDVGTPDQWPLLTVEFSGMMAFRNSAAKLRKISGYFQFLDCPGYNEKYNHLTESRHFKTLMERAARSADAVIPVLGLTNLSSNLPYQEGFFREEWDDLISAVVVTKIQEEVVEDDEKERLSEATWKDPHRLDNVLCCDSLLGLGGLQLRGYLRPGGQDIDILKKFQDKSDPTSELSLASLEGKISLESLSKAEWGNIANRNLNQSGIESTFDLLASYSTRVAQCRRLREFDQTVPDHMRALLEKLDSQMTTEHAVEKDLERSKAAAAEARKTMQAALKTWEKGSERKKSRADYQARVKQRLEAMEKAFESSIAAIIKQGVDKTWNNQEEARILSRNIIEEVRTCMEKNNVVAEKAVEELGALYRAELLDLLQKVAGQKFKNNQIIQAIITAKIASLQETTSALQNEVGMQVEESVSNKGWKEASQRIRDQLKKLKGVVPQISFKGKASTSARPALSNPSSSHAMLLGELSRSATTASSLNSTDCTVSSSQRPFLPVSGREQAPVIDETMANRVGALTETDKLPSPVDELELQEISASPEKLNTYISTNLVDPFLQTVRFKMTRLADAYQMENVYENTVLGMITEYEEALKKGVDQRQSTPEDRRVRSTLAQLQLWANITAAVSAINALSEAGERARQKLPDIGSKMPTPMSP